MGGSYQQKAAVTQQMSQELENIQRVDHMKGFSEYEIWSEDVFFFPSGKFNSIWQLFALQR